MEDPLFLGTLVKDHTQPCLLICYVAINRLRCSVPYILEAPARTSKLGLIAGCRKKQGMFILKIQNILLSPLGDPNNS